MQKISLPLIWANALIAIAFSSNLFSMEPSIQTYKTLLRKIASNHLHEMKHEKWSKLTNLITPDVLADANSKASEMQNLFKDMGLQLIPRREKAMARIEIKKTGSQQDIHYKVNSDFSAFRIYVSNPFDIESVVEKIQNVAKNNEGFSFIRSPIKSGDCMTDIVQYIFVYIPSIGYITEFQVGHPFAAYTFTLDSARRDLKDAGKNYDHIANFWNRPEGTDWTNCFYIKMRTKILNPETNFDIDMELKTAFGNLPVDNELVELLKVYRK